MDSSNQGGVRCPERISFHPLSSFALVKTNPVGQKKLPKIGPRFGVENAIGKNFIAVDGSTDKKVRSTHGVNCTGSCSWEVYVKDGIIVSELQAVDYPSCGPDFPDHEPRGCPRGATYSWYTYSPLRLKYPYVRSNLLEMWRSAMKSGSEAGIWQPGTAKPNPDPVAAWQSIIEDPIKRKAIQQARGKGGFVRVSHDEAVTTHSRFPDLYDQEIWT